MTGTHFPEESRCFISYTTADRNFADRLAIDLQRAGLEVWYDTWEIKAGESIIERVNSGIRESSWFLILISKASIESRWVRQELNSSLTRKLAGRDITVIPIILEECTIPETISDLRYLDFSGEYRQGLYSLLRALRVGISKPAFAIPPMHATDLDLTNISEPARTLFPVGFSSWPRILVRGNYTDAAIIIGSTPREQLGACSQFGESSHEVDIFGFTWKFARQCSPGTVRDMANVTDLAARVGSFGEPQSPPLCVLDVAVSNSTLERDLIIVGGPDTNLWFAIATIAFRQRFGYSLPIRYRGDEQLYFTCDEFYSEFSGSTYSRLEEAGSMHAGYILAVSNPWNPERILVFVSGTRATGTQAALLALCQQPSSAADSSEYWQTLHSNNRYSPNIPAKVVRATRARIVNGDQLFGEESEITVHPGERISQRHSVTGFEYLE